MENSIMVNIPDATKVVDFIKLQLSSSKNTQYYIINDQEQLMINMVEKAFPPRVASGGWVFNPQGDLLLIKRMGLWDIPKGHLEENEDIEQCAIREVEEETGIDGLVLGEYLGISRHFYPYKGKEVIKEVHWYMMTTASEAELIPQSEEGIEEVKWVKKEEIVIYLQNSWTSIYEFYLEVVKPKL